MPSEGQLAPDFTLNDQNGNPTTLSTLKGQVVILYFYPKDDTPGCTTQACSFRDSEAAIEVAGATVLGISPDTEASHAKFATKYSLSFRLLADPEQTVCQLYDVWRQKSMYGKTYMGVERTTFLIDESGTIRKVIPKVKVANHAEAMLAEIATFSGE